tara:strand:+ start:843 stop:983 length:141 start_codon:yes stop_codon:yes gene_type:complete
MLRLMDIEKLPIKKGRVCVASTTKTIVVEMPMVGCFAAYMNQGVLQ